MASVLCSCGWQFELDGPTACPLCGRVATFPHVSTRDAEDMRLELGLILADHTNERETPPHEPDQAQPA